PVMDARTAYLITDILSDNYARRSTFGAGSPLRLDRPAAAKTGTTQDWRDNWTVGYTPEMVVGVWVGNADNEPMRHVSGVTGAAPIWRDVTQQLLKTHPAREFPQPPGLIEETVCALNGLLPVKQGSGVSGQGSAVGSQGPGVRSQESADSGQGTANREQRTGDKGQRTADNLPSPVSNLQSPSSPSQTSDLRPPIANRQSPNRSILNSQFSILNSQFPTSCPHTLTERFIPGTEPHAVDTWHQAIAIDRRTGLRAGPGCSPEVVTLRTFTRYPAEAVEWAIKQGVPQPPEEYSPLCPAGETETNVEVEGASGEGGLVFVSPDQGTVLRLVPNIPLDKQKIRIQVRPVNGVTVSDVALLINGQPLAPGYETLWQMEPGRYTFEAVGVDPAGNEVTAPPVSIEVVR
ncbi:MAG: hypothetical protein KDI02_20325, partial [Anaerolineae bacterium]|nr:hypothetical protein [Anaerolineae bacterium]